MNPLRWHRDRQIALAICIAVGGVAGVILGYSIGRLEDEILGDFGEWALTPFNFDLMGTPFYTLGSIEWFAFGGLIGAAILYAVILAKKSN